MTHIMLDLETWGKVPGSDIRSIGACVFDPIAGTVGGVMPGEIEVGSDAFAGWFYRATENPTTPHETSYCESCGTEWIGGDVPRYPLTRDLETVQWWNDQTPEAQAAFVNPVDLREACVRFASWINDMNPATPPGHATNVRLWANDPHFDVSILDAVFRAVQLPTPWHYRSPRSMRTIVEAAGMTSADYSNYGTAHNALDDAIAQAMTVCEAYKRLGLQR